MTGSAEATVGISPWASIWIRPWRAIRQVLKEESELWLFVLASVCGTLAMLKRLMDADAGDSMGLPEILAVVLLAGPVAGIIMMYVIAAILRWTGRWFGGQAHSSEIAAAYAWSNVVQVPVLLLYVVLVALLGLSFFSDGFGEASPSAGVLALMLASCCDRLPAVVGCRLHRHAGRGSEVLARQGVAERARSGCDIDDYRRHFVADVNLTA